MSEETFTIESLVEANDILQEEVSRLRNSNRILRTVHSALRAANESLRAQIELAKFSDEAFKRFCAGEFDAPVTSTDNGVLPASGNLVDPLV
jgi:L-2-hydroxyglutarate oxidase LhgO